MRFATPSRAVFPRSILGLTLAIAAGVAGLCSPHQASAQAFPFGFHVYADPGHPDSYADVHLAKDGTAAGATFYRPSVNNAFGARIDASGITTFPEPSEVSSISDGGQYTADFVTRRSAAGVSQVLIPNLVRPQVSSQRTLINGNGTVVAGSLEFMSGQTTTSSTAYRWTEQGGVQYLPAYRAGAIFTSVRGISRDGNTLVGKGRTEFFGYSDAWKWTALGGFSVLPGLPGAVTTERGAAAVNSDGSIIVGYGDTSDGGGAALVWRGEQVTPLLPVVGYRSSAADDLSDTAGVVTGRLTPNAGGTVYAIWTNSTSWVPALDYLRSQGASIPSYWVVYSAIDVSADGRTFSFVARDTRNSQQRIAIVVIPSPSAGAILSLAWGLSRRRRPCCPHHS